MKCKKKVVVSQPMFLPWYGVFEQIRLSDLFVHYDDVQYPLGSSFMNRVQIITSTGVQWLTAPVRRQGKKNINQTFFDESTDWRGKHLKTIERNYKRAKYFEEMFELLLSIYKNKTSLLSEFNIASIDILSDYLGLKTETQISSQMNVREKSSRRLLQIIQKMKGTHYLTGHGARNYLEHELFEKDGIDVEYMEYKCSIYPQLWEREFTQYVSIIDMIAHCGSRSIENMNSETVNWLELIKQN